MSSDYKKGVIQVCPKCHSELRTGNWDFCPYCGHEFGNAEQAKSDSAAPLDYVDTPPQPKPEPQVVTPQIVTSQPKPTPARPAPTVSAPKVPSSPKNNSMLIGGLVGAALLVIAVVGYFVWYVPYAAERDAERYYATNDESPVSSGEGEEATMAANDNNGRRKSNTKDNSAVPSEQTAEPAMPLPTMPLVANPSEQYEKQVKITATDVNLRQAPTTESPRLMIAYEGQAVIMYWSDQEREVTMPIAYHIDNAVVGVVGETDEWYRISVSTAAGTFHPYLMKQFTEPVGEAQATSPQPEAPAQETPQSDAAVNNAPVDNTSNTSSVNVSPNMVYDQVDEQPEFPGGTSAMMQYLNNNIKYPSLCKKHGVQGRVVVQFVVNRDGSITDITVIRYVDPYLDKEAIRVVTSMPKWKPAKKDGTVVKCRYTLPITFKLQ